MEPKNAITVLLYPLQAENAAAAEADVDEAQADDAKERIRNRQSPQNNFLSRKEK
jgi:hypothetical protein